MKHLLNYSAVSPLALRIRPEHNNGGYLCTDYSTEIVADYEIHMYTFLLYFRPQTEVLNIAPPCIALSFTFFLLSRNTLKPSNSLSCVFDNGLPLRFKSIIEVFVNRHSGIGCGLDSVKLVPFT